MHKINSISDFLSEYPLLTPFKAVENHIRTNIEFTHPYALEGSTLLHYCDKEGAIRTFELEIPKYSREHWANMPGNIIPNELFNKNGDLDFTYHYIAECKSCKSHYLHFMLHVYSDNPIPRNHDNVPYAPILDNANIYIEKLGAPVINITVNSAVEKYLDRESNSWYFKAKKALADNLGIGAFAYFRRIIEKELIRMVEDISKLNSADPKMIEILNKHKNSTKPHLVYNDIFQYLPKSLQALGDNPFKILYQQTSDGLHSLSEDKCIERSKNIEMVLDFVIIKINEEKSVILDVKNAIKALKTNP